MSTDRRRETKLGPDRQNGHRTTYIKKIRQKKDKKDRQTDRQAEEHTLACIRQRNRQSNKQAEQQTGLKHWKRYNAFRQQTDEHTANTRRQRDTQARQDETRGD